MRRLGLGLLVGICAWSLAGPAAARPVPPAPDAPVVASLPGGATLVAFDHGADLCFGLRRGGSATCDAPPHGYLDPRVEASGVNGEQVVYGVTTSDATSVEVLAAGASATGPVSGGAYAGRFAGQVQAHRRGLQRSSTDAGAVTVTPTEHCDPSAMKLTGLAGSDVQRIDAVLGDGTRRRLPLHPLPTRFGDPRHAYALVLAPGIAVRALRIAAGGRVRVLPVGQAPGGATCTRQLGNGGAFILGFGASGTHSMSTGPLVARDDGDLLCVGLGAIGAGDCQVPPIDPLARIDTRGSGAQRSLLAVVPPEVAALRLTPSSGPPITVPTTDLPGYTGRYVGLVRVATVVLPAGAKVYDTYELAADGHLLQHVPGPDQRPLAHAPAVLARLPGGVVVAGAERCVQVGADAPTRDRADCRLAFGPIFISPCAARRIVVVARARRLSVRTDRGVIRGQRKGRLSVAVVPRDAALRSPVRLPPAARQCGYTLQT